MEKGRKQTFTLGNPRTGRMNLQNICLRKCEGPDFMSSQNQQDLKPRIFKIGGLGSVRPQKALGSRVPR